MNRHETMIDTDPRRRTSTPIATAILSAACLLVTGCSDDSNGSAGSNSDAGTGGNTDQVFFIGARVRTPDGDVDYLGAYSGIPSDIDPATMWEFGHRVQLAAFGENVFAWDSNSATVTKYGAAEDLSIQAGETVSFADTGLAGSFTPPAIFSATQAYFFALDEGKVVEWNPSDMTITDTIDVDPLSFPESPDWYGVWGSYIMGEKIILPVEHAPWDNLDLIKEEARIAIFDPSNNTLTYDTDDRMLSGFSLMSRSIDNPDELWYYPSNNVAFAVTYGNYSGSLTQGGLLRVTSDGVFADDSLVELIDVLDAGSIRAVQYVFDNKAAVVYHASAGPTSAPDNSDDFWAHPTATALVDLESGTHEPVEDAFDDVGGAAGRILQWGGTDLAGNIYFGSLSEDLETNYIYTLASPTEPNVVLTTRNLAKGFIGLVHQAR